MNQQVTYDRIMQTAMGFWASKTLMSAVELGIFDALAGGPLDAKALRLRVGVHERARPGMPAIPLRRIPPRPPDRIVNDVLSNFPGLIDPDAGQFHRQELFAVFLIVQRDE